MSVPRPVVDAHAQQVLDALEHPISITRALRDANGAIIDFTFVFVNRAAASWSGLAFESVVGERARDLAPALVAGGLFEALVRVVETGEPLAEAGARYEGSITGGDRIDGRYDLYAVRLADGYLSAWRRLPDDDVDPAGDGRDLRESLRLAQEVVRLVRLESRPARPRLCLGFHPA